MRCGTFSWCVNHCVIHPWSYLPNCKLLYFNFPPLTYWTSKWLLCALFKHFQRLWGLTKSHFEDLPDHFNEQILTLSTPNRSSCQCGLTYYVIMLIAPHAYSIRAGDSATSAAYKRYLQSGWGWKLPHLFFFFPSLCIIVTARQLVWFSSVADEIIFRHLELFGIELRSRRR